MVMRQILRRSNSLQFQTELLVTAFQWTSLVQLLRLVRNHCETFRYPFESVRGVPVDGSREHKYRQKALHRSGTPKSKFGNEQIRTNHRESKESASESAD